MNYCETVGIPQGWQCPCCKRVYSPTTFMCTFCGGGEAYVANKTAVTTFAEIKNGKLYIDGVPYDDLGKGGFTKSNEAD